METMRMIMEETIQRLSDENAVMEDHIRLLNSVIDEQYEKQRKLKKENEFLKKQNEALKYLLKGECL